VAHRSQVSVPVQPEKERGRFPLVGKFHPHRIVSMRAQGYPSAWLHPSRARFLGMFDYAAARRRSCLFWRASSSLRSRATCIFIVAASQHIHGRRINRWRYAGAHLCSDRRTAESAVRHPAATAVCPAGCLRSSAICATSAAVFQMPRPEAKRPARRYVPPPGQSRWMDHFSIETECRPGGTAYRSRPLFQPPP
jgi:hypothetical protein